MLAKGSDDEYSDENYDGDEFDDAADAEADMKLEKLRKAMNRENTNAAKVAAKTNKLLRPKDDKAALKMGPATGKGTVTMAQITQEVSQMDPSQFILPNQNQSKSPMKVGAQLGANPQF